MSKDIISDQLKNQIIELFKKCDVVTLANLVKDISEDELSEITGYPVLCFAVIKGNIDLVLKLVNADNIENPIINLAIDTPMGSYVHNFDVLEYATMLGQVEIALSIINKYQKITLNTILTLYKDAALYGQLKVLTELEDRDKEGQYITVENLQKSNWLVLFSAIQNGNLEIIKYLISKYGESLSPEVIITSYESAGLNGQLKVLQLLDTYYASFLNNYLKDENNCLGVVFKNTIMRGHINVAQYLLDEYETILTPELINKYCFDSISSSYRSDITTASLEYLIKKGKCDVNFRDKLTGHTILSEAMYYKHNNMVDMLIANGADFNDPNLPHEELMETLIKTENIEGISKILSNKHRDINEIQTRSGTLIEEALFSGSIKMMELLIEKGASVEPLKKSLNEFNFPKCLGKLPLIDFLLKHRLEMPNASIRNIFDTGDLELIKKTFDCNQTSIGYAVTENQMALNVLDIGSESIRYKSGSIEKWKLIINLGASLRNRQDYFPSKNKYTSRLQRMTMGNAPLTFTKDQYDLISAASDIDKIYYAKSIEQLEKALASPISSEYLLRLVNLCRIHGVPKIFSDLLSPESQINAESLDEDMGVESVIPSKRVKTSVNATNVYEQNKLILAKIVERKNKETQELLDLLEEEIGEFLMLKKCVPIPIAYSRLKKHFAQVNDEKAVGKVMSFNLFSEIELNFSRKFYENNPLFIAEHFLNDCLFNKPVYLSIHRGFARLLFSAAQQKLVSEQGEVKIIDRTNNSQLKDEFFDQELNKNVNKMNGVNQDEKVKEEVIPVECNSRLLDTQLKDKINTLQRRYFAETREMYTDSAVEWQEEQQLLDRLAQTNSFEQMQKENEELTIRLAQGNEVMRENDYMELDNPSNMINAPEVENKRKIRE